MKIHKNALIIIGLSTALALSGCGVGEAQVADQDTTEATIDAIPVEVTLPERTDMYATYAATAAIGSEGDANVLAKVGGDVVELLVEEGDVVQAGQVLARLDGERLRLEMLAAHANLEKAQKEYDRNVDLAKRGLVSEAMFESLKFDLDALRATYDLRKLNYEYSSIRASIDGFIAERYIKPGQNLTPNQQAFRITDTNELVAYLQIPQTELSKFSIGHDATLTVDSLPGASFTASVIRISPTIDIRNGTFKATALVDNRDGALAPGMFARFVVEYEKHANALSLPLKALIVEDEQTSVYVVNDDAVALRKVTTGVESNGRVEILDGLSESDQVVVVGQSALRDGSKVLASTNSAVQYSG